MENVKFIPDMMQLASMLEYRRPEGSGSQKKFCNRYLRPVFGKPDAMGNYSLVIGDRPAIAFMAHHDTVHNKAGKQRIARVKDEIRLSKHETQSNCLGADCTTGVWLVLHMIKCGISGVYVVHASEESGGQGARYMLKSSPKWLDHVDIAISFDRKGESSIITHQAGRRTASDSFAQELSAVLGGQFKADSGGTFTDSEVYSESISECTNLSVGYSGAHTSKESQSITFAYDLAEKLGAADWTQVKPHRDPSVIDYADALDLYADNYPRGFRSFRRAYSDHMEEIVADNPREIAELLRDLGYTPEDIIDACHLHNPRDLDWLFSK